MSTVNPKHYYIKIEEYGKIIHTLESDFAGYSCSKISAIKQKVWRENFKVYPESEEILKTVDDPDDFTWFPLYRSIGKYDEDFDFENEKDAIREYESHIGEEVFCYLHDC